jgi:predicted porin
MKKFLLGTTALATAGLAAGIAGEAAAVDRIKLGLAGYHQQWLVAVDQDYQFKRAINPDREGNTQTTNVVDQKHNSEICFIGETTLDNGITFGVNVQLEANTEGDQIDESYLYVSSPNMGRFIAGDENNAGYLLHVTAPDGGVSMDSGDLVNINAWENPNLNLFDTAVGTTNLRFYDNDSGKVTYISPRFAGFQLGLSFIPQFEAGGDTNTSRRIGGSPRNNEINNGWAGGVNFTEDFNGFGVKLSLGGLYGDNGADDATGNDDDLVAWNGGAQFSYAGFSFGGAYNRGWGGAGGNGPGTQINSQSYIVGAAYETGPYSIGINYMRGTSNQHQLGLTTNGQDRLDQFALSGGYQLGPGIRLVGALFAFDGEDALNNSSDSRFDNAALGDRGEQNDGYGFTTGLKLSF